MGLLRDCENFRLVESTGLQQTPVYTKCVWAARDLSKSEQVGTNTQHPSQLTAFLFMRIIVIQLVGIDMECYNIHYVFCVTSSCRFNNQVLVMMWGWGNSKLSAAQTQPSHQPELHHRGRGPIIQYPVDSIITVLHQPGDAQTSFKNAFKILCCYHLFLEIVEGTCPVLLWSLHS